MVRDMNGKKLLEKIQNEFSLTPDLIIKEININHLKIIYAIYLESVCTADKVNAFILKDITLGKSLKANIKDIRMLFSSPNLKSVEVKQINFYLTSGFTIVFTNYNDQLLAIETKAELDRGIQKSEFEQSLIGPKDSFTENYQKNLGIIKRRLKTSHLKMENFSLGRLSNTTVSLLYIDNIAGQDLVNRVKTKLNSLDIDAIFDVSNLVSVIDDQVKRRLPIVKLTEKPDYVCHELMSGKIAIIADNSPAALVLPAFFIDFISPVEDNYKKPTNINIIKIIRLLSLIITIFLPALYISLVNYNREVLPISMLINFTIQQTGVPFPTIIEAFIMLLICEILRETDLRFPNAYGSSMSIIGALIIGEAAVSAGLVSPIMIIIIAITFITGLMFTDAEIKNEIRRWTIIELILSSITGLYGLGLGIIFFLIHICSIDSFGIPYFFPIAPFNKEYFEDTVIESINEARSSYLTDNIKRRN